MTDAELLRVAVEQARAGFDEGGVPIGAAIFCGGKLLGAGRNRRVQDGSQIDHGEMNALRNSGCRSYRGCTMATTLMPCAMCAGAIVQFGFARLVVGENSTFSGERAFLEAHDVEVVVLDDPECRDLLRRFIAAHPEIWNEDIGR